MLIGEQQLHIIKYLFTRELRNLNKQKILLFTCTVYPIIIMFLLFYMFHNGVISKIPIAVVDQSTTISSRELIQRLSSAPEILIAERFQDLHEAKISLRTKEVYAVVLIPANFESASVNTNKSEVVVFYNNQFLTAGSAIQHSINLVSNSVFSDFSQQQMTAKGVTGDIAKQSLMPVPLDMHPLYNPTLNYSIGLAPTLYLTITHIILMFTVATSALNDRFMRFGFTLPPRLAKHNLLDLFIGKFSLYIIIFSLQIFLCELVLHYIFGLKFHGNLILLAVGVILAVISSTLFAILFSTIFPRKITSYGTIGIFSAPAFGFTGIIFPRLAMNYFSAVWGSILPCTWLLQIQLDQSLRGTNFITSLEPFAYLLLQIIVVSFLICRVIRKNNKKGINNV